MYLIKATMHVHPDFFLYREGVYRSSNQHLQDQRSGYHSVRIVGWGVDSTQSEPVKYWVRIYSHLGTVKVIFGVAGNLFNSFYVCYNWGQLVANSWGRHWGENGYFRIVRGQNDSDIEKFVLASWADQLDEETERK